jgi:hypothetical protein
MIDIAQGPDRGADTAAAFVAEPTWAWPLQADLSRSRWAASMTATTNTSRRPATHLCVARRRLPDPGRFIVAPEALVSLYDHGITTLVIDLMGCELPKQNLSARSVRVLGGGTRAV